MPSPANVLEVQGDLVEFVSVETFDLEFAQQAIAALTAAFARHPRVFVLAASGGVVTPEARRLIRDWLRGASAPVETAVWGGGTVHRVVAQMVVRSVQMFTADRFPITFHRTRADALAWIAARRAQPTPP